MRPVVPVPMLSDDVPFKEFGAKRTVRSSGWMEAMGAVVRKESLRGSGHQKSDSRPMQRETTYKISVLLPKVTNER